jgi:hypothetical protein
MDPVTIQVEESYRTPSIPCSMELATHFQKFVEYWAGVGVDYLGMAPDDPLEMPVEVSLKWKGPITGTLIIRCFPEFLHWLKESRDYKPLHLCTQKEIFHEMSTLYCIYLIQSFWIKEASELGLILPRASRPSDWPRREPDATCSLLAGHNPVEIRLWMDGAPEAWR